MKYKTRPGTVLTRICDEYMIIASRAAREYCPSAIQINETGAYIWKMVEKGLDTNEMISNILKEYELDKQKDVSHLLNEYLMTLQENGFLLKEDN